MVWLMVVVFKYIWMEVLLFWLFIWMGSFRCRLCCKFSSNNCYSNNNSNNVCRFWYCKWSWWCGFNVWWSNSVMWFKCSSNSMYSSIFNSISNICSSSSSRYWFNRVMLVFLVCRVCKVFYLWGMGW